MIEGGEVFAIRRRRRMRDGLPVPLQIELKEADHLDGAKFGDMPGSGRIAPVIQDGQGNRAEQFESGLIACARGGKDI